MDMSVQNNYDSHVGHQRNVVGMKYNISNSQN